MVAFSSEHLDDMQLDLAHLCWDGLIDWVP